jgi:predicted DNA-binding antitoxin AbrB/MazE fold protein
MRVFGSSLEVHAFRSRVRVVVIIVEAVAENGVIKPAPPLPFQEHERVQVTVKPAVSHVRQTAGLIGWTGSQEDADFVALRSELDPQEPV